MLRTLMCEFHTSAKRVIFKAVRALLVIDNRVHKNDHCESVNVWFSIFNRQFYRVTASFSLNTPWPHPPHKETLPPPPHLLEGLF